MLRVFMCAALECQEVVIAAALAAREGAAKAGARLIYVAAPRLGVEELADATEMFIRLSAHCIKFVTINLGKLFPCGLEA
jgi:N-acetylmuramic acid 6-phosphate (MurNAc-6-P) etherase